MLFLALTEFATYASLPRHFRQEVIMKLEFITQEEAESIKRKMPKSKVMEEYEDYIKQLPENRVGRIEVTQKDGVKPQTVRARLNRASKNLEMDIQTRRVANTVLFWCEQENSNSLT
jgi:hypothetical protein